MRRASRALLLVALTGAAVAPGCGASDRATGAANGDGPAERLIGTWSTSGVHPELGAVEVQLTLRQDGSLTMVAVVDGGGRLSFPGIWELQGEWLVLRGPYFEPDGLARTRYSIRDDGALILEDEAGNTEVWGRV